MIVSCLLSSKNIQTLIFAEQPKQCIIIEKIKYHVCRLSSLDKGYRFQLMFLMVTTTDKIEITKLGVDLAHLNCANHDTLTTG